MKNFKKIFLMLVLGAGFFVRIPAQAQIPVKQDEITFAEEMLMSKNVRTLSNVEIEPEEVIPEGEVEYKPIIDEDGNLNVDDMVDKALEILNSITTWVILTITVVGVPGVILVVYRSIKLFKLIFGRQKDNQEATEYLISLVQRMLDELRKTQKDQDELKRLMLGIISMSNFDALKKEHLMNKLSDTEMTITEVVEALREEIEDGDKTTAEVRSILSDLE